MKNLDANLTPDPETSATATPAKQTQIGRYYLPTPPLGQDMTQGQFLSGV